MPPTDDSPYPRQPAEPPASRALWWSIAAAVLVAGAAAAYYFWPSRQPAPTLPGRAETAPAQAAPKVEPAIRHSLDTALAGAPAKPLPSLDESDPALGQALAELLGKKSFDQFLKPEKIIRNIVATIDNLPREVAPSRVMPLTPTPGAFVVSGKAGDVTIGSANPARYASRIRVLQAIDARRLVDLYLHFYPLFQKAYAELGYPNRYFNDRLIEALDDMLAAPDLMTPVKLTQPKILYQYADSALEARSAGQKIMIRIGVANEGLVKAKLREIRREILGRAAKQ